VTRALAATGVERRILAFFGLGKDRHLFAVFGDKP